MGLVAPARARRFEPDLRAALELAGRSTTAKHRKSSASIFHKWAEFCVQHGTEPSLRGTARDQQLNFLLVFFMRYRVHGQTGESVRADTVAKAITAVGKGIADMGQPNPTKQAHGSDRLDPLLAAFVKGMRNQDSPSGRAYPVSLLVVRGLRDAIDTDHYLLGTFNELIIDLIVVAFYFLLRPSEYLRSTNREARTQAFRLHHITLTMGGHSYLGHQAPLNDENRISGISKAALTFSDQKNAVRGETIGHNANSDPFFCPAKALGRIARRLQQAGAPPDTPIHRHFNAVDGQWYDVSSTHIKNALRHSAGLLHKDTGVHPSLYDTRGMRPGGATALLCAGVDADRICLLGRWLSDAMFRYLRAQAATKDLSEAMLTHGEYTFAQGAPAGSLPNEAPPGLAALMPPADDADD